MAPEHKAALKAAVKFAQTVLQPSPQPKPKAPEHKPASESFQPALKAAVKFAQTAMQPSPQPKPKASEHKPAFASFAPKLTAAVKLAQTASQPAAPAPSSGGWSSVAINRNGTFTLPSIGTFPLPAPGKMEKIPLQDGKFFKIRQRADGAYEGKFGPDSQPAPKQPLPARLEDRKKDAGGWAQIEVDRDGMIRVPGIAQPLYRPKPGQTDSVPVDARTTFRFRQGADGDVYGTFETKAPSQPPPGWQRVNVDPDGMIRVSGIAQPLYRPQPGQTQSVPVDARTTFKFSQAEDGEVYGTFETKAPSQPPPGWRRVNVDPDGMIRLPGRSQPLSPPPPGKTESIQLDAQTTLTLSHAEDGEIHGNFETKLPDDAPGLEVDESKESFKGVVSTLQLDGKKVVNLGTLGTLVAPAVGGTDAYLMDHDKLLVLDGNADGTVKVSTRTLGIKSNGDGFKGPVMPSDGVVEFAGRRYDVSKLKNGEEIKDEVRLEGTKFKLKVRMNHDGTVTIIGNPPAKNIWQKLGDLVLKVAPFLAAIPGMGLVAVAAKVVTAFNAVKNFAQSLKNGNWLGMAGSLAGAVAGFSQGAVQAFASKVANIANVGQQVMTTLKHGLGNGLLQVVSNGANLVSGIAQAAADLGQGGFQSGANNLAQATGTVAGYAGGADSALKGDLVPLVTQVAGDVVRNNPPQVKNPVANPPPVPNPFQVNPLPVANFQVTQFQPPPPSIVKPPKDANNPVSKPPAPSIVKPPKDAERPFAPGPAPVLVAGPPTAERKPQTMLELFRANLPTLPTLPTFWGTTTDVLSNAANIYNSAPILLGLEFQLPFGEIFPNFFTTTLGAGADVVFKEMGAQQIGQSFLWARRPWSDEAGEVRATPIELTANQTRNNLAYVGLVQSANPGRFGSIASMYEAAKKTGASQTNVFTARNPLLGSMKINVTVAPDGRVAANLEDGWRWATTFSDGEGGYTAHGGGAARNFFSGMGELLTFGKRVVVPVTSETVTTKLQPGEKRSDIEILRSFGPRLDSMRQRIRALTE